MRQDPSSRPGPWLVNAPFDLAMLLGPLALAVTITGIAIMTGRTGASGVELWAFLILVVAVDVAHVWATAYRTYLDTDEVRRRPVLYLLPIPAILVFSLGLHRASPSGFWTFLAYFAIYHFITQNYGLLALYKARAGERDPLDYRLDKATLWTGALGPVLAWHASPASRFDWFHAGEVFLVRFPEAWGPAILGVSAFMAFLWVLRQAHIYHRTGRVNPGKLLVMGINHLTWWVGIAWAGDPVISAAFINLFHGIPFLCLVWLYGKRKWAHALPRNPGQDLLTRIFESPSPFLFLLPLLVFAFAEESLWDLFIWHEYLPAFVAGPLPRPGPEVRSLIVAILILPQFLHYVLDAYIWRFDESNPDLKALLGLSEGSQSRVDPHLDLPV